MSLPSDYTLDSLITEASTSQSTSESHLSYPSASAVEQQPKPDASAHTPQLCTDRIYVGNLHPSVDEYTLFQVFSKFGKVIDLDFLFHKSGPQKGKPRGYAFVKYASESDAQKAMSMAHDKLLRGRKIVVTYAHYAPLEMAGGGTGSKGRRTMMEIGRPTALSMLKSGSTSKPMGTAAKIAKMEAKLRQLESVPASGVPHPAPLHPSLPPKPQTTPPNPSPRPEPTTRRTTKSATSSIRTELPAKQQPSNPSLLKLGSLTSPPAASSATAPKLSKPKLVGVKIKPKEKDRTPQTTGTPKSD